MFDGLFGGGRRRDTRTIRFSVWVTQRWHSFYGWITTKMKERRERDGDGGGGGFFAGGGDGMFGGGGRRGGGKRTRRRGRFDW